VDRSKIAVSNRAHGNGSVVVYRTEQEAFDLIVGRTEKQSRVEVLGPETLCRRASLKPSCSIGANRL
jgi:hypothetical protein